MKFWVTVGFLGIAIIAAGIFGFIQHRNLNEEREAHASTKQQLNALQADQQITEATVQIFRVSQDVNQGTLFNPALVEVVPIPESLLHDRYVRNPAALQGAIWRLPLKANSIITYDMLVFEPIHPTDRLHVVTVEAFTPSLIPGAFVDIRMHTPEGIDFVVLPRMRVVNIYSTGLEMVLSETQWMIYLGALIDRALNPGTILYAGMYVDPGLQPALYATYVPPRHIIEFMNVNRNMLFPYVDGTDVVEIRHFIESTFPRNLYRHTLFTTPEQAIRDRESRIAGAMMNQRSATTRARGEFVAFMQMLYAERGEVWEGDRAHHVQVGAANVQGGTVGQGALNQQPGQIRPGGTWVDDQGVERNPDGSPVIQISDLFDTGTQNQQQQAEFNPGGFN